MRSTWIDSEAELGCAASPPITQTVRGATPNFPQATETFDYEANGYRSSHTDFEGNVTKTTYNDRGLLELRTDGFGSTEERSTTIEWHPQYRVQTRIIRPGQTEDRTYYPNGRLQTRTLTDTQSQTIPYVTTGNTRTWAYTYNTLGLIETIDGPRTDVSDVTTYGYDANGDLETVTNALGYVTEITQRNARGQPTRVVDANGIVTVLSYNERGWMTTQTIQHASGDAVTAFSYEPTGQLDRVTRPDGSFLDYDYDAAMRLVMIADNNGDYIDIDVDLAGNPEFERTHDSAGTIRRTITRVYDELSRLRNSLGADGQNYSTQYDDNGNAEAFGDAEGRSSTKGFWRTLTLTRMHT